LVTPDRARRSAGLRAGTRNERERAEDTMVQTASTMLTLGTEAPNFSLPTPDRRYFSRDDAAGSMGLLVMFICNHCPYVIHVRDELARIGRDYGNKGIGIVAISSNDVEKYPDDSPEKMAQVAKEVGFTFPYLYDESQEVAKAYTAACTPDFFLFNGNLKLVYRGQLDGSRPKNDVKVTGGDLRAAMDALLSNARIPDDQLPSLGCNIKWKEGNEPDYA
jgi:peroxiredoxin